MSATPALTEKQFSQQVYDLARMQGWLVARFPTWRPTGTSPGYPDLTMVRDGRLIFAELKVGKGKPSHGQQEWLNELVDCQTMRLVDLMPEVYVWTPEDWELIVEVLER